MLLHYSKLTQENITEQTTEDLAKLYYEARDGKAFSKSCLNNAIILDVTERKLANAKKNYEQDKRWYALITNELTSRGIKTVYRDGSYN